MGDSNIAGGRGWLWCWFWDKGAESITMACLGLSLNWKPIEEARVCPKQRWNERVFDPLINCRLNGAEYLGTIHLKDKEDKQVNIEDISKMSLTMMCSWNKNIWKVLLNDKTIL